MRQASGQHSRTTRPFFTVSQALSGQRGYLLLEGLCAFSLLLAGILTLASLGPVVRAQLRIEATLSQAIRVAIEAAETTGGDGTPNGLVSLAHTPTVDTNAIHACAEPTAACAPGNRFVVLDVPALPEVDDKQRSGPLQPLSQIALWVRP